jgi:hypothetical protein
MWVRDLALREPIPAAILSRPMTDSPDDLRTARNHLAKTILAVSRVLAASPPVDVDELSRVCDLLGDAQGRLSRYDARRKPRGARAEGR